MELAAFTPTGPHLKMVSLFINGFLSVSLAGPGREIQRRVCRWELPQTVEGGEALRRRSFRLLCVCLSIVMIDTSVTSNT